MLGPVEIKRELAKKGAQLKNGQQIDEIIFFIKGHSEFLLRLDDMVTRGYQGLGQSYQMFRFVGQDFTNMRPRSIEVIVIPPQDGRPVYLVGPFVF